MCDKHVVRKSEANIHNFLHPSELFGICAKILQKDNSKTNFFNILYLYFITW